VTITLSLGATTATTQSFTFAAMGATGTIDLQISPRVDFKFCVCPIYSIPRASPYVAPGLNQDSTYFARARTVLADGTVENWSNVVGFRTPVSQARVTAPAAVMIEPAIILRPETVIGAVWGSAEVPGFPIANLFRDAPVASRAKVNRADGLAYFDVILNGSPVDTVSLLNTNLPEAASVYFSVSATSDVPAGAGVVITAEVPFRATANLPGRFGYHGLFTIPKGNWRSIRVHIVNLGNMGSILPGGLIHIEHMVIGRNRKTKNHAVDKSESSTPLGTLERTRSGNPDRRRGLPMRKVEFEIAMMTEAHYETEYGDLIYQQDEPIFVVPNSKTGGFLHDRILLGDLSGGRVVNPVSPRYTRTFVVDSLI
jgi:hypothetical protein